jgi:peptidoglycan glycosyltransferase
MALHDGANSAGLLVPVHGTDVADLVIKLQVTSTHVCMRPSRLSRRHDKQGPVPRRRRRSMFASGPPRRSAGVPWLEPGHRAGGGGHYRRHRRRSPLAYLIPVLLVVAVGAVVAVVVRHNREVDRQRDAAAAFTRAYAARDVTAMWDALDPASQKAYPRARFAELVRRADTAATVRAKRAGQPSDPDGGTVTVPVAVTTRQFGTLRGAMRLDVEDGGVRWRPQLRLPGLRAGEAPRRRTLQAAHRASALTYQGQQLVDDPTLNIFAKGLRQRYHERLAGTPGAELLFGRRRIARVAAHAGRSVHSTLRPGLQRAATAALGNRLGGVAVVNPRNGDVLALAGIAVSAPQPPGSTFKIITLSAALASGAATPSSSYPVRTAATLSGVRLANASNESCGGSLAQSFAESCNSVFAPLGAKMGAKRLVARAEAFGFNETPRIPVAKPSTIPEAKDLPDAINVGSAAIGQNKDLATPLAMASVGATIGARGVRAKPRAVREDPVIRRRAVSAKVAGQVRDMMIGVVRGGTGTAAALPGVTVAGKTGTAELRFTGGGAADPKNTDAWFVAFAPAGAPKVAVGVMLVGAGAGGKAAAPIARQVLAAALSR